MKPKTTPKAKRGTSGTRKGSQLQGSDGISRRALEPEVLPKLSAETEEEDLHDADGEPDSDEAFDSTLAADADGASEETGAASIGELALPDTPENDLTDHEDEALSGSRAISPSDPLRRYLEEVRRYPLLPADEEFRLVNRLRQDGDIAAAKALVSANLRLVVKIAMEYRSLFSNVMDLIQEGNVGLMKAVSKYDPTKGARLGYYAAWWIRSYILKYLLDNFRLVKIGTTQAQKKLFYHLMREKDRLEAQGLLAGPKLLAERLNVREKDVVEMETRLSGKGMEMSLDSPVDTGSGGGTTHLDLMVDQQEGADEALARNELLKMLKRRLPEFQKTLNEKERQILKERLLAEEPKTLQEVADVYGLTRERARQIEAKVIAKLREFLL